MKTVASPGRSNGGRPRIGRRWGFWDGRDRLIVQLHGEMGGIERLRPFVEINGARCGERNENIGEEIGKKGRVRGGIV
jgi:hypothetical protein